MAKFELKGKTVVITGASSGIGAETALAFAKRGAKLVLSGRNLDALVRTKEKVEKAQAEAYIVPADVTKKEEVKALVEKAIEQTGRIDVILLGAGFGVLGLAENIPLELWEKQFAVNFWGVLYGFYSAIPYFIKQKSGQFIIINSLSGRIAMPISSAYCASKFALWGFVDSARVELEKHNIDIISIYPSFVMTDFHFRVESPDFEVPADLARRMMGDRPEKIAKKIVRASENRKAETLCTFYGNLGARFLPMSYYLAKTFQNLSLYFTLKVLKKKA